MDLDESTTEYNEYEEDVQISRTLKPLRLKQLVRSIIHRLFSRKKSITHHNTDIILIIT